MTLLMALVGGWVGGSVLLALGLGPVLRGAAVLAERHEGADLGADRSAA